MKKDGSMSQEYPEASLSIIQLPSIITNLFERAQHSEVKTPTTFFVRYLRRKAERGLAVIYTVDDKKQGQNKHDQSRLLSLTLDEQMLEGSRILFNNAQARQAAFSIQSSGALRAEDLGLSVQIFPADESLPALATCCDISQQSSLLQNLEDAAQYQLSDQDWRLISATVAPVRYKPSNRCVLRYTLTLVRTADSVPQQRNSTIFGKVYANRQQAYDVQTLQQKLYQEQISRRGSTVAGHAMQMPLLPQPLGINEVLGLTLTEAIQPANEDEPLHLGSYALRPHIVYGRGGNVTNVVIPTEELQLTAIALARLHTSTIQLDESMLRTGAKEAKRTRERARLIAASNPGHSEEIQRLAQHLGSYLEAQHPDVYRLAHGGFKASQLLFHSHHVFVVDFDGLCLADPALDVGYFLAYLRLWYARSGMREWFEASAKVFISTYRQAMLEFGVTAASVDGIAERSKWYEAALLFKIATRRVNRLNSPRPQELSAMLREIATCLFREPGRG
ncbi:MAG: hypothetical protein NVS4B12_26050 [Ktedonobacteraceae bacterium]